MDTPDETAARPSSGGHGAVAGHLRWDVLGVIALGGAIGAVARYAIGEALGERPGSFPWSTFLVNVSGCLLMGVLMVLVLQVWTSSRYLRPLLGVGVLGGFTTFSTYALDARDLLDAGRAHTAALYLGGSVAACLLALWVGVLTGHGLLAGGRRARRRRLEQEGLGVIVVPGESDRRGPR